MFVLLAACQTELRGRNPTGRVYSLTRRHTIGPTPHLLSPLQRPDQSGGPSAVAGGRDWPAGGAHVHVCPTCALQGNTDEPNTDVRSADGRVTAEKRNRVDEALRFIRDGNETGTQYKAQIRVLLWSPPASTRVLLGNQSLKQDGGFGHANKMETNVIRKIWKHNL